MVLPTSKESELALGLGLGNGARGACGSANLKGIGVSIRVMAGERG